MVKAAGADRLANLSLHGQLAIKQDRGRRGRGQRQSVSRRSHRFPEYGLPVLVD